MLLANRITALEQHASRRWNDAPEDFDPRAIYRLMSTLDFMQYDTWRHAGLSLEERLALARDDVIHADAEAIRTPSSGCRQNARGLWVNFWPDVGAREIAIRIGERDGLIDEETADALRDNSHAHFFEGTEALNALPYTIEFDHGALVKARAACPRREDLSLEQQLTMLNQDHDHEIAVRIEQEKCGSCTNATFDPLNALQDRMHEILLSDLQVRIRDANRPR